MYGFDNNFMPYQQNMNMMRQPYTAQFMQQQTPTIQNTQQPMFNAAQVATIEQVEQVQMSPGERKIIIVQNQPVVAMRTADNMGLVDTRFFQLVDYNPHAQKTAIQGEFAPLALVQEMQTQITALSEQITAMKGAVNNAKSSSKRSSAANA